MKTIIFVLAAMMSVSAFADSVSTKVGSFKGKLSVASTMDVKKVEVVIRNQFCNFWGSTCAGGPRDVRALPLLVTESSDGKTIDFSHDGTEEYSSLKLGNRFSSCNVDLIVEAVSSTGQTISGSKSLVWVNDKAFCESQQKVTETVLKSLSKPLVLTEGFNYISIK